MAQTKIVYQGSGGTTLLFLVFLILKLTGTINWSWWWVFAPIWIPVVIILIILLIALIGFFITK